MDLLTDQISAYLLENLGFIGSVRVFYPYDLFIVTATLLGD